MTRDHVPQSSNGSLQEATAELVRRLKAGEPCRAEGLLAAHPDLAAHEEAALELLYSEFVTRRQLGEKTAPSEWYGRFPHWRDRLERLFILHEILDPDSGMTASRVPAEPRSPGPEAFPAPKRNQRAFERYERREKIGRGAMGVVYKAVQSELGRVVAIKVLLAGAYAELEERQRFHNEARTIARLRHANIVQIYDFSDENDEPFLVMEFVEGGNLAEKIAGKPQSPGWAAELVETLTRAMHYAHQQGIIHRDLKPANILLESVIRSPQSVAKESEPSPASYGLRATDYGLVPKITDFGLAKWLEEGLSQTVSGEMVGTPSYMAPEQAWGKSKEVGVWTDVYALGAILYELLTGRPPFVGETRTAVLQQVPIEEPVPPRRLQPGVPRDLETICLKCLEKEPARRYATAEALAEDLRRYREREPIRARRAGVGTRVVKRAWRWRRTATLFGAFGLTGIALTFSILWYRDLVFKRTEFASSDRQINYVLAIREAQHAYENGFNEWAPDILARQQPSPGLPDLRDFTWYYLWRLRPRECQPFVGHRGWVNTIAFSPDGQLMATGGDDRTVKVWDLATCLPRDFIGHQDVISKLAFAPDGKTLASSSWDKTVKLWDVTLGKERKTLHGHAERATCVTFSPDGRLLASGSNDRTICLWNLFAGTLGSTLRGHQDHVHSLAFTPDGKTLFSGAADATVMQWDVATGQGAIYHRGDKGPISSVACGPMGQSLAWGCSDHTVNVGDVATRTVLHTLRGHTHPVSSVAYATDGRILASSGGEDGTVRLWDPDSGRNLGVLKIPQAKVGQVSFGPPGRVLAVGTDRGMAAVWDVTRVGGAQDLQGRAAAVRSVAFSPDSKTLATAGEDHCVRLWNTATGKQVQRLQWSPFMLRCVAFAPDGSLLAVGSDDCLVRLWDVASGKLRATLRGHGGAIRFLAFSPDGKTLATASNDNTARVWDLATEREKLRPKQHPNTVRAVAFSADNRFLASSCEDGWVILTDLVTGFQKTLHDAYQVWTVAFSPDSKLIASGNSNGEVKLWEVATEKERAVLRGHSQAIKSLAFSPDGKTIASGGDDHNINLWDLATRQELITLKGHAGWVNSVAFSAEGTMLASGSHDGFVKLWHAPMVNDTSSEFGR